MSQMSPMLQYIIIILYKILSRLLYCYLQKSKILLILDSIFALHNEYNNYRRKLYFHFAIL